MIRDATTFVIGAGASSELGFPTGDALKDRVVELLGPELYMGRYRISDDLIHDAIIYRLNEIGRRSKPPDYSEFISAAQAISKAMPHCRSIDDCVGINQGNGPLVLSAKLSILRAISEAERACLDRAVNGRQEESGRARGPSSWHSKAIALIGENISKLDRASLFHGISMIIFNYDRCIEEFFSAAVSDRYDIERHHAESLIANMPRVHPYGMVGPWREGAIHQPFGAETTSHNQLLSAAENLRTLSDPSLQITELNPIPPMLDHAETLIFLGFAFHPSNIKLFGPPNRNSSVRRIFGTVLGMAPQEVTYIRTQLAERFPKTSDTSDGITLVGQTCADFFNSLSRSLAR